MSQISLVIISVLARTCTRAYICTYSNSVLPNATFILCARRGGSADGIRARLLRVLGWRMYVCVSICVRVSVETSLARARPRQRTSGIGFAIAIHTHTQGWCGVRRAIVRARCAVSVCARPAAGRERHRDSRLVCERAHATQNKNCRNRNGTFETLPPLPLLPLKLRKKNGVIASVHASELKYV